MLAITRVPYPGLVTISSSPPSPGVLNLRVPQLTAAYDHPGEELPIFRLAFDVMS